MLEKHFQFIIKIWLAILSSIFLRHPSDSNKAINILIKQLQFIYSISKWIKHHIIKKIIPSKVN